MCELLYKIKEKKFTGYKIVVKTEKGEYFSPAMGIKYTEGMEMPCINKKNALRYQPFLNHFKSPLTILTGTTYRSDMQGRTSVFVDSVEALHFYHDIIRHNKFDNHIIIRMTISEDLMKGKYQNYDVIAGKKIEKIEEL